jgi:hypothetical protein
MAGYELSGLPDLTKVTVTSLAVAMGVVLFDAARLMTLRLSWLDLPMAVWCLCPLASSISNGLGAYDGASAALTQTLTWGAPYVIGRLYFGDAAGLRELAAAIVIGALMYAPLCLYEIRMSPQLHRMVYGYHQHSFNQTYRFGGYRPTVFMQHGLMVGMWMSMAALLAAWLWKSGAVRTLVRVPFWMMAAGLGVVAIMCKSLGAAALLAGGLAALFATSLARTRLAVAALVLAAPGYLVARIAFDWNAQQVVDVAMAINADRAESLAGRIENEELLKRRAEERLAFGWGGWGRSRVYDDEGEDITTTDSQWIIAFGQTGMVGLVALTAAVLLPPAVLAARLRARAWSNTVAAPAAGLAVVLILYSIDNLLNAMVNPVFILAAGGLAGALHAAGVSPRAEPAPARAGLAAGAA